MPGIYHTFSIKAPINEVFKNISSPKGLNTWWTKECDGNPAKGVIYHLNFGDEYQWEAIVTKSILNKRFELEMTKADEGWMKTKIGFELTARNKITEVSFYHKGWKTKTENYKGSSYCWAMYLRILKRYTELGEKVPYNKRLSV